VISDRKVSVFSVLISCYNHEKYINDALQSVLAQTYDDIEIIICDDYSPDHSWNLIQSAIPELEKRFCRVVAFRNDSNRGLIYSLNKMIREAEGNVVFLLSGDDMMAKNYASDIMCACMEHPDALVFVTDGYCVEDYDHYQEIDISRLTPFYEKAPDLCKDTLFERLYWENPIFAPGVSLRKEIYDKFGLYDVDNFIEDWEYWLRISRTKETEFVYIDKKDVFYRKNPNSVSSKVKNDDYIAKWLNFLNAREKIIDKYGAYVGKEEYVKRKWAFMFEEVRFYQLNIPEKEKIILREKWSDFVKENWKELGWKKVMTYCQVYINSLGKR